MKKLLCFLGILVLLFLVLLPPALRIFLPKEKEENVATTIVRKNLRCSNDKYIIGTSYDNENIKSIVIKKFITNDQEENSNQESNAETEIDQIFTTLKKELPSGVSTQEDGEAITIDFSVEDNLDLSIKKLNRSIEVQKSYYENQNMVCTIM